MAVHEQERFGTGAAMRSVGGGGPASGRDLDRPGSSLPAGWSAPTSQRDLVRLSLMLHPDTDDET
jgi:hypothetical protein